eukprot:jgi/Picsp_1/3767/NSC_06602-R1_expressed protein [Chlorella variabilis]
MRVGGWMRVSRQANLQTARSSGVAGRAGKESEIRQRSHISNHNRENGYGASSMPIYCLRQGNFYIGRRRDFCQGRYGQVVKTGSFQEGENSTSNRQSVSIDMLEKANHAFEEADILVDKLEEARQLAEAAKSPAAEAEKKWQEGHSSLRTIQERMMKTSECLRSEMRSVLDLQIPGRMESDSLIQDMILHHLNFRLQEFVQSNKENDVELWRCFDGIVEPTNWMPDGWLGMQSAAGCIDGVPYLVGCISVAMKPLDTSLRSLLLHWSVTDGYHGSWMGSIPTGWHTFPSISQPCGPNAWQTTFSPYCPGIDENMKLSAVCVHSIVLQIPMAGHLLDRGGIKFVLKRADGYQPEWIKPSSHHDFFLDFSDAIEYLNPKPIKDSEEMDIVVDDSPELVSDGALSIIDEKKNGTEEIEGYSGDEPQLSWARSVAEEMYRALEDTRTVYEPTYFWLDTACHWEENDLPVISSADGNISSMYMKEIEGFLLCLKKSIFKDFKLSSEINQEQSQAWQQETTMVISKLLDQCSVLQEDIQQCDAADMKLRQLQIERDLLWETHNSAAKEAGKLLKELEINVAKARKCITFVHGREAEVIPRDLSKLCLKLASDSLNEREKQSKQFKLWFQENGAPKSRKLVFVSESVEKADSVDAYATIQVFLEGDFDQVNDILNKSNSKLTSEEPEDKAPDTQDGKQESPSVFDAIVIAVAFGESFPGSISSSPMSMHFGMVSSQHSKWIDPPAGWHLSAPQADENEIIESTCPMESFYIQRTDDRPIFVDPVVKGICLRFPIESLTGKRINGIEFVLKNGQDGWMKKEGGSNFYAEFPLNLA